MVKDITVQAGAAWKRLNAALELRRDVPQSERDDMNDSDFAGKGDSYPIHTPEDVHAAAMSIGRAGPGNYSSDQLKANIIRIAKRKGAAYVEQLPDEWKDSGS